MNPLIPATPRAAPAASSGPALGFEDALQLFDSFASPVTPPWQQVAAAAQPQKGKRKLNLDFAAGQEDPAPKQPHLASAGDNQPDLSAPAPAGEEVFLSIQNDSAQPQLLYLNVGTDPVRLSGSPSLALLDTPVIQPGQTWTGALLPAATIRLSCPDLGRATLLTFQLTSPDPDGATALAHGYRWLATPVPGQGRSYSLAWESAHGASGTGALLPASLAWDGTNRLRVLPWVHPDPVGAFVPAPPFTVINHSGQTQVFTLLDSPDAVDIMLLSPLRLPRHTSCRPGERWRFPLEPNDRISLLCSGQSRSYRLNFGLTCPAPLGGQEEHIYGWWAVPSGSPGVAWTNPMVRLQPDYAVDPLASLPPALSCRAAGELEILPGLQPARRPIQSVPAVVLRHSALPQPTSSPLPGQGASAASSSSSSSLPPAAAVASSSQLPSAAAVIAAAATATAAAAVPPYPKQALKTTTYLTISNHSNELQKIAITNKQPQALRIHAPQLSFEDPYEVLLPAADSKVYPLPPGRFISIGYHESRTAFEVDFSLTTPHPGGAPIWGAYKWRLAETSAQQLMRHLDTGWVAIPDQPMPFLHWDGASLIEIQAAAADPGDGTAASAPSGLHGLQHHPDDPGAAGQR